MFSFSPLPKHGQSKMPWEAVPPNFRECGILPRPKMRGKSRKYRNLARGKRVGAEGGGRVFPRAGKGASPRRRWGGSRIPRPSRVADPRGGQRLLPCCRKRPPLAGGVDNASLPPFERLALPVPARTDPRKRRGVKMRKMRGKSRKYRNLILEKRGEERGRSGQRA